MSGPKIEDGFQVWRNASGEKHREDGPAVEGPGHQEWYINGLRHREDGPAQVTPNCTSYYIQGRRHRTDGPAFSTQDYEAWWVDGLRHRHDGPAIIDPVNGDEYWLWGIKFFKKEWEEAEGPFKIILDDTILWRLRDGRLHQKDGPAVERPGRTEYWQDGLRHREDGPAVIQSDIPRDEGFEYWLQGVQYTREEYVKKMTVISTDEDGTVTYKYMGQLHREDGPAVVSHMEDKEGKFLVCIEFWREGKRHREDGPAYIGYFGDEEYWKHGVLHREDGPAIINVNNSTDTFAEIWIQNGKRHREGGPAVTAFDGTLMYYEHGKIHRIGGPAITGPEGDAWYLHGTEYSEEEYWEKVPLRVEKGELTTTYFAGNVIHRIDGPAAMYGNMTQWIQRGKLHRKDGPAIVAFGGSVLEWYLEGVRHREDGPAVVHPEIEFWYFHGKLHRVGGPAIIRQGPAPLREYCLEGKTYSKKEYDRILSATEARPSPLLSAYHQTVSLAKIHTASSILSTTMGAPSSPTFQAILRILIPTLIHRFSPSEDVRRQAEKALEAVFFEVVREKIDLILRPLFQALHDPAVRESLFSAVESLQESE